MQIWNLQDLINILIIDTGVCSRELFQYAEKQKETTDSSRTLLKQGFVPMETAIIADILPSCILVCQKPHTIAEELAKPCKLRYYQLLFDFRQGIWENFMKAQGARVHRKVKNHWVNVCLQNWQQGSWLKMQQAKWWRSKPVVFNLFRKIAPSGTLLEKRPLPIIFLKTVFCFENNSDLTKYKLAI